MAAQKVPPGTRKGCTRKVHEWPGGDLGSLLTQSGDKVVGHEVRPAVMLTGGYDRGPGRANHGPLFSRSPDRPHVASLMWPPTSLGLTKARQYSLDQPPNPHPLPLTLDPFFF